MIFADYHTHTIMSHGKCTPDEVVRIAYERGLKKIAISEHAPRMSYGLSAKDFMKLRCEIDRLNAEYSGKIEVLMGIESNFCGGGKLDIPKDIDFDVIIAGYHKSIPPLNGFAVSALVQSFTDFSSPEKNTDEILRTLDRYPQVNILAHPGAYIKLNIKRIAEAAAQRNLLLEINNNHVTLSVDDLHTAAQCGARFVINSDGHISEKMCKFDKAFNRAQEAGVLDLVENYTNGDQ